MLITDIIHDVSNRRKHFLGGVLCGLFGTLLFAAGAACGLEFKDSNSNNGKWDWLDWWSTILGGTVGQAIQIGIIILLF